MGKFLNEERFEAMLINVIVRVVVNNFFSNILLRYHPIAKIMYEDPNGSPCVYPSCYIEPQSALLNYKQCAQKQETMGIDGQN